MSERNHEKTQGVVQLAGTAWDDGGVGVAAWVDAGTGRLRGVSRDSGGWGPEANVVRALALALPPEPWRHLVSAFIPDRVPFSRPGLFHYVPVRPESADASRRNHVVGTLWGLVAPRPMSEAGISEAFVREAAEAGAMSGFERVDSRLRESWLFAAAQPYAPRVHRVHGERYVSYRGQRYASSALHQANGPRVLLRAPWPWQAEYFRHGDKRLPPFLWALTLSGRLLGKVVSADDEGESTCEWRANSPLMFRAPARSVRRSGGVIPLPVA